MFTYALQRVRPPEEHALAPVVIGQKTEASIISNTPWGPEIGTLTALELSVNSSHYLATRAILVL